MHRRAVAGSRESERSGKNERSGIVITKKQVRVGSRDSKLAVVQAEIIMAAIARQHPEIELTLVPMKTTGDMILDRRLDEIGGKGLFVKELDRALREGRIDISVHSLKDMPMEVPDALPLLAFSQRENPFDAWVLPAGAERFDTKKPIGSSSPRRCLQIEKLHPGSRVESVRGNLQTRLAKLDDGEYGALILACAGLQRLGLAGRIARTFSADEIIPAAGQGTLCVQGRAGEDYSYLDAVDCPQSRIESLAERAFVAWLDGGCSSPIAAYAQVSEGKVLIRGMYFDEETKQCRTGKISGEAGQAQTLAQQLAEELQGGKNA